MAKTLDVYLHKDFVGQLIQDDGGQMVFDYAETWLRNSAAVSLSNSLPLRKERFTQRECRGFFGGILPEADKREIIARNLGISNANDYAMLERIGGECAGAVTFVPEGEPFPEQSYDDRQLNEKELADIIKELPRKPLLAGEQGMRLSLAGAQDKIAIIVNGDNISLPLGGAPSTHLLKPAIERFEGLVYNEAVCMTLANKIGLPTAQVEIRYADGIDYLLVKRYDRKMTLRSPGPLSGGLFGAIFRTYNFERLHQEDFCQALGVPPEKKYQTEGGPSLKQCFDLLRNVSSIPAIDLQYLLDAVIFNVLIGNHDAHSKNFSLIYDEGPSLATHLMEGLYTKLAPLYDLVNTVYYPELSVKMAMKIGGESQSENLFPEHFEKLAEETGLAKPMVVKRVLELAEMTKAGLDEIEIDHPVAHEVIELIKDRCDLFISRFQK